MGEMADYHLEQHFSDAWDFAQRALEEDFDKIARRRRLSFNQVRPKELKAMGVLKKKPVTKKAKAAVTVTTVRYARLYKTEEFENHRFEAEATVGEDEDPQVVLDSLRQWIELQNEREPGDDLTLAGARKAIETLERFAMDRERHTRGFEQCIAMLRELLEV